DPRTGEHRRPEPRRAPQPPARRPRQAAQPRGRPVRDGAVRRHRRPGPQEADAGGVRPRQPRPAAARLRAHRLRPPRLERAGLRERGLRRRPRERPHPVPRRGVEQPRRGHPVRPRGVRRRGGLRQSRRHPEGPGRRARHRRQPRLLPLHPAPVLPRRHRAARARGAVLARRGAVAAGGGREAVRARPGQRPGAQRRRRAGLPRRLGVPHRPLPRQGDGAEPPGAALRQRDVRAAVELPPRRPRADHHGRGHRHRGSRRLLRRHRGGPRRHPEPPPAAARADRDGGAGVLRRPRPAGREGEGPRGGAHPRGPRRAHRARPVRPRLAGQRAGARLPRGGGDPRRVGHRDLRGDHPHRRLPPVGGRAVLPARRQAPRAARHRDRRGVQEGPAPALRVDRHRGARAERPRGAGAARRGHHPALRLQGARHRDGGARRLDGLRVRALVHRVLPRGVRATDPRRAARRPTAVPPAPGGRPVLEGARPDHRALVARRAAGAVLLGDVGPALRDGDARPLRSHLAPAV
ncbi:MAG: Glucose-6-phosphate 1-dehydrogenase, partial [uncultured Quadrisphaera sp.]